MSLGCITASCLTYIYCRDHKTSGVFVDNINNCVQCRTGIKGPGRELFDGGPV